MHASRVGSYVRRFSARFVAPCAARPRALSPSARALEDAAVNYVGHAALALERSRDPRFVLGAMLPDLVQMVRVPLPALGPEHARGVAFHEWTDAVFHGTDVFVESNRRLLALLREAGVSRGPARAIAHMGAEMLIDSALLQRAEVVDGYVNALEIGAHDVDLGRAFASDQARDLSDLLAHLARGGAAIHAPVAERFSFRFARALDGRRLLEPTPEEAAVAARIVTREFSAIEEALPRLWQELLARESD